MSTGRMDEMKPRDPEELVILEALRLSPREREIILDVLRRDEALRKRNQQRVMRLKAELQALRRRGALRPTAQSTTSQAAAPTDFWSAGPTTTSLAAPTPVSIQPTTTTSTTIQVALTSAERSCARCRVELGRIINRGAICRTCRQRVCKACREYSSRTTDWVCCVCHKHMEIQAATGEWIHEFKRRSSLRRDSRTSINLQPAADIIKRTIRRSWTISNPQPRWSYLRGSSESRPYNSLPRGQDPEPTQSLAPPTYDSNQSLPPSSKSTSPIPSPIPSPLLLREPPASPQPQLSPRLLSPRNHSQELRRSYTDGQSIYISPLLRQRSPKREPSPELFVRPTIEVDDVLGKKPLKSPSGGGRISPRRSPLQKEFPSRFGRPLPESLNISQSKIDTPPKRISPLAKAYSEEPKIPPESPQHRPELKSFSSQGSQDLPKPPSALPPSKFFQEVAKKMATETKSSLSPRTKSSPRTNEFFDCIDSVPKFAPRRLGGSTTSFEEVVKAVLERKAANEEKSASFEKHVSFENSDPTSSRKNSMLYEKDDTKMKSESYLVKSSDVARANEKIKSYSTDDKRYQPFNTLDMLKSESDPNTTGANEDLSMGVTEDEGDVEVLSGTLFRKVTVKRRRQEMKKTSAIDNGGIISSPSPLLSRTPGAHVRYHRRSSHKRTKSDNITDLLTSIELDSIATGRSILLPPPDGEDYKLVFISSASDSSSSSNEDYHEDEADDEDFNDSCSNLSSPASTAVLLNDECDWDYFDTSFVNTVQRGSGPTMLHYWANSPRQYLTPSPIFTKSRRGESDTGTDEDSVSRLGESSSESSNSNYRHPRQKDKCCPRNCQNCGSPQKQYIPIPVPVPIPVPIPTLWNPQDSIILYNPDSTMDAQLQLRLQNIHQTNMATANGIWLWPYCNKNIENPFVQNIMNPSAEFINSMISTDNNVNQQPVSTQNEIVTPSEELPVPATSENNNNIVISPPGELPSAEEDVHASASNTMEVIPQSDELSGYLNSENNHYSSEDDVDSSSSSAPEDVDTPRRRRTVQRTYNVTDDGDKRFSDEALPSSASSVMESSSSDGDESPPQSDDGIMNDNDNESSSSSADDETDSDDTGTVADRKSSKRFSHVFVVNNNSSSSASSASSSSSSSSDNDTDTEKDCLNCVLNSIRALSDSEPINNDNACVLNSIRALSDSEPMINNDNSCVLKQFKVLGEDYLSDKENLQPLTSSESDNYTESDNDKRQVIIVDNEKQMNSNKKSRVIAECDLTTNFDSLATTTINSCDEILFETNSVQCLTATPTTTTSVATTSSVESGGAVVHGVVQQSAKDGSHTGVLAATSTATTNSVDEQSANNKCNVAKYTSLVMITQETTGPPNNTTSYPGQVSVITSETTRLISDNDNQDVIVHHTNWESDKQLNTTDDDELSDDNVPEPNSLSGYFITLENNASATRRRPVVIQRNQSDNDDVDSDNVTVVTGGDTLSAVICLEEGLADDDSWVEDISHDEEEFASTTPTTTTADDESSSGGEESASLSTTAVCTSIIDREEELRGYHRSAIDFTLHTIVEESCEESEVESLSKQKTNRPHSATDLEKYFFYGLAENNNDPSANQKDSFSETSSIYSESIDSLPPGDGHDVQTNEDELQFETETDHLASSRLEKYFLSGFMGFTPERRDSDGSGGSVGSDSEGGRPSPEQRRKRLVRARGTGRSHSSSLDNLLTNPELSNQEASQNESQLDSEGSSTETDTNEDVIPPSNFDKLDGQFDTVKRKKCKKSRNTSANSTQDQTNMDEDDSSQTEGERDDSGNKTPQPEFLATDLSNSRKQQSRDSGFVGSCDDLVKEQRNNLNETVNESIIQSIPKHIENTTNLIEISNEDTKNIQKKFEMKAPGGSGPPATSLTRKDSFNNWSSDEETNLMMSKMRQFFKTMVANSQQKHQHTTVVCTAQITSKPTTPIMGNKDSPRLIKSRGQKPPQLIYFENELTRLMKTVPGIRDDQVREIVEYLSSEDTWSDSYDSSDYTSSDLEGATAAGALQQEISDSCQQIINKFDTSANNPPIPAPIPGDQEGDEGDGGIVDEAHSLNRETAFVYQKLVASFSKMATGDNAPPNNSPPLIAKVMHHIGSRLVALMHEVSSGESHASNSPKIVHRYHRKLHHKISSGSTTTTEDDDSTSDNPDNLDDTVSASYTNLLLPRSRSHDLLLSEARALGHHQNSDNGEDRDREASSDYERFSWRGSFESALMATHDSRTKLTLLSGENSTSALALAAKRRSAGDLLFNSHKSLSREQLDRVRSCGSICEDKSWVTTPTKPSRRRRSSVPDATRGDDDDVDENNDEEETSRSTLPRQQTIGTASSNSLPRLPLGGHHFVQNSNSVKSARYRPPGFNTFRSTNSATSSTSSNPVSLSTITNGPKRAVSAPGLQLAGVSQTRRDSRGRRIVSASGDDISLTESNTSPLLVHGRSGSSKSATPSPAPSNRSRGHSSVSSTEWPPAAEDDIDRLVALHQSKSGLSTLGMRSDSLASVYSGAGEGRYGHVTVRGQVEFGLQYNYKAGALEIHVKQCRDLAPVDTKRNRSDPYVKVYLLPDKSKSGKRKTKVKKHTLNPVFDETLKFHMTLNGLETRTLWLTVWHSDMFGRNDFLGEVMMALENKVFDDPTPQWYTLQERTEPYEDLLSYKGDIIVGLKFVPPDMALTKKGKRSKGALHVLIKEAKNLTAVKANGTSDPFCKTYLLPDKGRSSKQKTSIQRRSCNPTWNCTFTYDDVSLQELSERSLELTIWDHDRLASNEFLGGVRFSLGTGKNNGRSVDWMDATGKELTLWQDMLNRPNFWVEGCVPLRASLENRIS